MNSLACSAGIIDENNALTFWNSTFPWFWKSWWWRLANHLHRFPNCAIALLRKTISMILANFQMPHLYCKIDLKKKKKKPLAILVVTQSFYYSFKVSLRSFQFCFFFFLQRLMQMWVITHGHHKARVTCLQTSSKWTEVGGFLYFFLGSPSKEPNLLKKKWGFSIWNFSLYQVIYHHKATFFCGRCSIHIELMQNEIFYFKVFFCGEFSVLFFFFFNKMEIFIERILELSAYFETLMLGLVLVN